MLRVTFLVAVEVLTDPSEEQDAISEAKKQFDRWRQASIPANWGISVFPATPDAVINRDALVTQGVTVTTEK